jgi:hypothetical protein
MDLSPEGRQAIAAGLEAGLDCLKAKVEALSICLPHDLGERTPGAMEFVRDPMPQIFVWQIVACDRLGYGYVCCRRPGRGCLPALLPIRLLSRRWDRDRNWIKGDHKKDSQNT